MIIQSYNVTAASSRTFTSAQSTSQSSSLSMAREQTNAQFSGSTGQAAVSAPPPPSGSVGQGQNGNSQGQNGNSQGQNGNSQGQNVNGAGQNQNNQGQNVNNQGQNQDNDIDFKNMLQKAKDDRIDELLRLRKSHGTNKMPQIGTQRIPASPGELRAKLSQIIYQLLVGRGFNQKPHPQVENIDDWRGLDIHTFFGGIFGIGTGQQVGSAGAVEFEHFQYESETVTYEAKGIVKTADGREINIDINMHMSREFVSYMNISADTRLVDPIVINYGGTAASLTGEKFSFDLTMDGTLDSLSVLGEGSGFLAIDWNGDGIINDGSELFGPSTGCGFSELRKYDTDGNGWIDANDEIFDKLVVWKRDENGNDIVYTLKELGIGAIFLGDISTEFSFKGERNETLGVMRSTSFFIKQCGGTGTLSHIDLNL